jgi:lipopolysaccharide transport system permease protein
LLSEIDTKMAIRHWLRQLRALTTAGLHSRYNNTFAGWLWVVINPVFLFIVQALVFNLVIGIKIPNYTTFLLTGLLPWIFMSQTLLMTTPLITSSASAYKSFRLNPLLHLLSLNLINLLSFFSAFIVLYVVLLFFSPNRFITLLLFPVCSLPMILGVYGITIFFSMMNVFYRDTSFIVAYIVNIFFFATPVFYSVDLVPDRFRWIFSLNPFGYFIELFRAAFFYPMTENFYVVFLKALFLSILILILSLFFWRKNKNELYLKL